jgi:hypothetical protein
MVLARSTRRLFRPSLPALELSPFLEAALGLVNFALELCAVRDGVVLRTEAVFAIRVLFESVVFLNDGGLC